MSRAPETSLAPLGAAMRRGRFKRFWSTTLEVWTGRRHIVVTMPVAVFLIILAMFFLWIIDKLARGAW